MDHKLKFAHIAYVLVVLESGTKTDPVGALNAQVRAPKVHLVFLHRTCPTYPSGLQTQVCTCVLWFGHHKKQKENGTRRCIKCTGSCAESASCFFAPNLSKAPWWTPNSSLHTYLMFGHHVSYVLITVKKWSRNGPLGALNVLVQAPKVRLVFSQ